MTEYSTAGVLLIDTEGNIIAQHRDDKPGINSPGLASFFGGIMEEYDASPQAAAIREINEETNLGLTEADIEPFLNYDFTLPSGALEHEHIFIAKGISPQGLAVFEGQGYHTVKDLNDPLLAPVCRPGAEKWFAQRDNMIAAGPNAGVHRYAATLFATADGLYGQLRDDKPGIDQPGKIGAFGGACEGDETPLQAAIRELHEETDRRFEPSQLELLHRCIVWRPLTREYEQANVYVIKNSNIQGMKVFEGQGVAKITTIDDTVSVAIIPALRRWFGK